MFKDERGLIEDLKVGEDNSVTYITFKKGAVRGNHYHKQTTQYDIVLSGGLRCVTDESDYIVGKGEYEIFRPCTPHAYEALEDSILISICIGKRIGDNYAKDTYKTKRPLI